MKTLVLVLLVHSYNGKFEKEERITLYDVSQIQCVMGAQIYIAQWASEHPFRYVSKWKCEEAGKFVNL